MTFHPNHQLPLSGNEFTDFDYECMQLALQQAAKASDCNEVPVGAVLTFDNRILVKTHNQPIAKHDATAHAEILALRAAGNIFKNYRLLNTTLYVTLEPCLMCVGALIHARIQKLIFATTDDKRGAVVSATKSLEALYHNHHVQCQWGLMANEGKHLLQDFFRVRR